MLSSEDYNHLKLLYERFYKSNKYIEELLLDKLFLDADSAIQEKEILLKQIVSFEKPRIADIKQNDELNKLRLELIELEKNNIELVKSLKNSMEKEFSGIKKVKKVMNAYEPGLSEYQSTIDIKDEE